MSNGPAGFDGGQVGRSSLLNLSTRLLLLALNLVFVPAMMRSFGLELFGVLTMTWAVLEHFGWLNLGLSRACARFVARDLAEGSERGPFLWYWTAAGLQLLLGLAGTALLWRAAPAVVETLRVRPLHREEAVLALRLFSLWIPLDLVSASSSGVLQAAQRFGPINALSVFWTLGTYSAYALGIAGGGDLRATLYALLALKIVQFALAAWAAARAVPSVGRLSRLPELFHGAGPRLRTMFGYGGWIAAAIVIQPLLIYADHWMIGWTWGAATLPFYTVPFNLLMRIGVVPASLTAALFPAFTTMHARAEWERAEDYYLRAQRYLVAVTLPAAFLVYVWAGPFLEAWIGQAFAVRAVAPMRILAVGITAAALTPVSAALLDGVGRPDIGPRMYLFELPLNVALVWTLTLRFGLAGAAASWAIRAAAETVVLWAASVRLGRIRLERLAREAASWAPFAAFLAAAAWAITSGGLGAGGAALACAAALGAYAWAACRLLFDGRDWELFARITGLPASVGSK